MMSIEEALAAVVEPPGESAKLARRSSMRRRSSAFRRNSDLSAACGLENILLKLPHRRTPEELSIIKGFLSKVHDLRDLCLGVHPSAFVELCRFIKIEDFGPDEPICVEGEPGDRLYFILRGHATEYKSITDDKHDKHDDDDDDEKENNEDSAFKGIRTIQMPGLRVDCIKRDADEEGSVSATGDASPRAYSPPQRSPQRSPTRSPGLEPADPQSLRRASELLKSRAMSRRSSISRRGTYVQHRHSARHRGGSQHGGRMNRGANHSSNVPTLMSWGVKTGMIQTFEAFGELSIFKPGQRHMCSIISGQGEGTMMLSLDRGSISTIYHKLESEGSKFLTFMRFWCSRRILRKHPNARNDREVETCTTLVQEMPFMSNLKTKVKQLVVKKLELKTLEADTIICKQGDIGSHLYGVVSGIVGKHQQKVKISSEIRKNLLSTQSLGQLGVKNRARNAWQKSTLTASRLNKVLGNLSTSTPSGVPHTTLRNFSSAEYSDAEEKISVAEIDQKTREKVFGQAVATLSTSDGFGENALLKQNHVREFSCIAKTGKGFLHR